MIINYSRSYKALDQFVDSFNAKQETAATKIKAATLLTAKEIIRIYGVSLLKANAVCKLNAGNLPSLRTNNQQLSQLVKCSSRTIQRHLHKLQDAGIITSKLFHGSNANYEVWLNPALVLTKQLANSEARQKEHHAVLEKAKKKEATASTAKQQTSNCPYTYTGYTSNLNNNLLKAVESVENPDNPSLSFHIEVHLSNGDRNGNTAEIGSKDLNDKKFSEKNSAKKVEEIDGAAEIGSRAEELPANAGDPVRDHFLDLYSSMLWLTARNLLYKEVYLTERQIEIARQLIRKLYEPASTDRLHAFHKIYSERVSLVHKYLKKDSSRFVPLPYLYFDTRNPTGFVATKAWYIKHKERQYELKCETTLNKLIRAFIKNETRNNSQKVPPLTLFRQYETTLGKLGGSALTERFHAAILDHQSFKSISCRS